jgi:hypothetical protein
LKKISDGGIQFKTCNETRAGKQPRQVDSNDVSYGTPFVIIYRPSNIAEMHFFLQTVVATYHICAFIILLFHMFNAG